MKKYIKYTCLFLALVTGSLTLLNTIRLLRGTTDFREVDCSNLLEQYDSRYLHLTSVQKIVDCCDSLYRINKHAPPLSDTLAYLDLVSDVIKKRFCHGLAEYKLSDNWLLYLESRLLWRHFAAVVKPNDILRHNTALCSQQQLVFLSVMKNKGIPFRYVGMGLPQGPGHFVSEIFYDHGWHMSDVTFEPDWSITGNRRISVDSLKHNTSLYYALYHKTHSQKVLSVLISRVNYGEKNFIPGNRMNLFHTVNFVLIYLIPLLFLFLYRTIKA